MSIAIARSVQGPVPLNVTPVGVVTLELPAAGGAITGHWLIFGKVIVELVTASPIPATEIDAQITIPGPVVLDRSSVIVPPVASNVSQSFSLQGTLTSTGTVGVVLFCNARAAATAQFAQLMAVSVDTLG